MQYQQALDILASLGPELRTGRAAAALSAPRKFSLDHIRTLLADLGNPQQTFPSVLIAGTNGKGSTAATLASICHAAGLRTGLYTSPHLARVNERIRVSQGHAAALTEIPDPDFGRLFGRVFQCAADLVDRHALPHTPSYFELMTAVAFLYFAEQRIDIAILEVGLGGRLDATNVVEPIVSVITDIGIDHTEFLGNTINAIAREKAGILRENGVLVTLSQHPEANAAIGDAALALHVRGVDAARCLPPRDFTGILRTEPATEASPRPEREARSGETPEFASAEPPLSRNRYPLSIDGQVIQIDSPLTGHHQQRNLALAVATALELRSNHNFKLPNAALEAGVRSTSWPGRLEWLPAHNHAPLLLDVAHNPAGAWALRAAISQLPEDRPRTLIFSCLADKQIDEMARILLPLFDPASGDPARTRDHILFAPIPNPRAATVDQLLEAAHKLEIPAHAAPHLAAALHQAESITPRDGIIVATGSVYLIGELRALALQQRVSP